MNGAIVMPGETFSLNEYVGQRTEEKGYLPAGAIIGADHRLLRRPGEHRRRGQPVHHHAVQRGLLVGPRGRRSTRPHTLYITRYPEGIEATLGWPDPDLVFRNNTEAAVYIKTEYTDDSITVKFFGDNGGLKVSMERSERHLLHRSPRTTSTPIRPSLRASRR